MVIIRDSEMVVVDLRKVFFSGFFCYGVGVEADYHEKDFVGSRRDG